MSQYFISTLIENEGDYMPAFDFDAEVCKPDVVLRIGTLSIHMTPGRMKALGEFIGSQFAPVAEPELPTDSEVADIQYRESMQDAGRGHLLR